MVLPRLILVEGLPGTGKTTHAQRLADDLRLQGVNVDLFLEGDMQPCDLQWISRMLPTAFEQAAGQLHDAWLASPRTEPWDEIRERLDRLTIDEDGHLLSAYTKLAFKDRSLWDAMTAFREAEIHDGRVSLSEYQRVYLDRWRRFGEKAWSTDVTIMECAFLQCHVTELLGHHQLSDNEIVRFLAELIEPVRRLEPTLRYVTADDYPACIRATAETRPGWLEAVIKWVETSPYGVAHGLSGFDGAMAFFRHRAAIERRALDELGVRSVCIARDEDWYQGNPSR